MANEISVVFPYEKVKTLIESGKDSQYLKVTVGYDEKGMPSICATLLPYYQNGTDPGDENELFGCPWPPGC